MRKSLNDIALEKYGCSFHHLSAFGQREILQEWNGQDEEITMHHVDLARALQEAQEKVAKLERENRDLWEENEDLKEQLYDIEEADENSLSRQVVQNAGGRVRVAENLPELLAEAARKRERDNGENKQ